MSVIRTRFVSAPFSDPVTPRSELRFALSKRALHAYLCTVSEIAPHHPRPLIHAVSDAKLMAVLGPTNTGKTHYAIERMCGYASGMMGLPLRLLAREIYERASLMLASRSASLSRHADRPGGQRSRTDKQREQ